jgi:hypothetical protein
VTVESGSGIRWIRSRRSSRPLGAPAGKLEPEESAPSPAEQAQDRAQLLKFSACMRAQALTKFPDPDPSGGISIGKNTGFAPDSPQFKAAEKACRNFLPGAGGSSNGPVGTP